MIKTAEAIIHQSYPRMMAHGITDSFPAGGMTYAARRLRN